MRPAILHLDLDAFQAQVEQLRNPRLRGQPVIVGSLVVSSCSIEARRYGLSAGMPLRQALRLCPRAVAFEENPHAYRCFSEAAWKIARRRVPVLDTWLDEAYGDLTGTEGQLLAEGRELRREVREEIGLNLTVGIGSSRAVAKLASRSAKPDGLSFVPWGQEEEFVSRRPVRDLPDLDPAPAALLERFNIRTVADVKSLSLVTLTMMLGGAGADLFRRCRMTFPRYTADCPIPVPSRDDAVAAGA